MTTLTAISETPDAFAYAEPMEEDDDNDAIFDEFDLLPTVRLSLLNRTRTNSGIELVEAEEFSDPDYDDFIEALITSGPLTKAEEVVVGEEADSDSDCDLPTQQQTQRNHYDTVRAEYISASFFKDQDSNASLGINLGKAFSIISILSIAPNSPAAQSPLHVGDKLISINQQACAQMTTVELRNALKMPGMITLVVRNQGGAPDVVESMITKLYPDQKIGVGIKNIEGILSIGSIKTGGAAHYSLLNPQDKLLSINNVSQQQMNPMDAVQTIADAPSTVTIRAITRGVVLAEEEVQRVIPKWLQSTLTLQQRKPIRRHHQLVQEDEPSEPSGADRMPMEPQRFGTSSLNWITPNSSGLFQVAY